MILLLHGNLKHQTQRSREQKVLFYRGGRWSWYRRNCREVSQRTQKTIRKKSKNCQSQDPDLPWQAVFTGHAQCSLCFWTVLLGSALDCLHTSQCCLCITAPPLLSVLAFRSERQRRGLGELPIRESMTADSRLRKRHTGLLWQPLPLPP